MSEKALALIFINLGGEMLYVLDQRLFAQKINREKGNKIMQDIVSNMFSERFLEEIFRPQEACSRKALRTIFERLAHTSIMRLNESSMDKLFDLMTMAVKYQMSIISKPKEMLLVTFNHLDSILPFIADSSQCCGLIDKCYKRIAQTFLNMNEYELQFVRYTVMNFFQDLKIKVSVFLKEKVQNWDGSFVLYREGPVAEGTHQPGLITYYDADSGTVIKESNFNPGARYSAPEREGSYERKGDRITKLGLNVYSSNKPVDTIVPSNESNSKRVLVSSDYDMNVADPKSRAQLDLLCRLIGKANPSTENIDFKLNLFNNDEEEFIYNTRPNEGGTSYEDEDSPRGDQKLVSVYVDASSRKRDERLNRVFDQFEDTRRSDGGGRKTNATYGKKIVQKRNDSEDDDDDIVAMMDKMNR